MRPQRVYALALWGALLWAGLVGPSSAARYVADLPECQAAAFQTLLQLGHGNGDLSELQAHLPLLERCTLPPESERQQTRLPRPTAGVINFETPQVHPLALTPNGELLLAVNTAANTVELFSTVGGLSHLDSIPVGHDPVTVRARSDSEAWVVNHISDSISVVDLRLGAVVRTLAAGNEPSDVVFAASQQRAFVSSGDENQLLVFALDNLGAAPAVVELAMEEPRALALSPDGATVYVAAFESGNATTVLSGRPAAASGQGSSDVISRADSPYGGQNPAPNAGANFSPALTAGDPGGFSSLVVRKDGSGRWMDDNSGDWSAFVSGAQSAASGRVPGWDLLDHDLAEVDTQTLAVNYSSGLMNINAALAVSPTDGQVAVVGMDASNQTRFESNLNGTFLQVLYAAVGGTGATVIGDLNPHLDYSVSTLIASERERAVGDPRGVVWDPDGSRFFVAGMGSNNVVAVAADGSRIGRVAVGQGPTGIVVQADGSAAYVLNRFDGSISRFDPDGLSLLQTVAFFDPTPEVIKRGRPHLYNTHSGSGLGQISCASCHVDARTDRLAWDLGNPAGAIASAHPMKGVMQTQTLVDIIRFPSLHWRGDRFEMLDFNKTFSVLQGAEAQLNGLEIVELESYLSTLHYPPNPHREIDNSLSNSVELPTGSPASQGDAVAGRAQLNACLGCHSNGLSRSNEQNLVFGQAFTPPAFHGFYKRAGFRPDSATGSLSGVGVFHDGADAAPTAALSADLLAALMSFEGPDNGLSAAQSRQDTHAAVGLQLTIGGSSDAAFGAGLTQLMALAQSAHLQLIAKRGGTVGRRGYLYDSGTWQSDRDGESITHNALLASADAYHPITFSLVVAGTGERLALDRDLDGELDYNGTALVPTFGFTGIRASQIDVQERYQLPVKNAAARALVFSASGLPTGLTLHPDTGVISGVPSELGESTVVLTVMAGEEGDRVTVTWRVLTELPVQPAVSGGAFTWLEILFSLSALASISAMRRRGSYQGEPDSLARAGEARCSDPMT